MKNLFKTSTFLLFALAMLFTSCGSAEEQVAKEEIEQYEMCMRNNDYIGAAAHAGVASAAYQQAGDEENYRKWKKLEDEAMAKATEIDMQKYGY